MLQISLITLAAVSALTSLGMMGRDIPIGHISSVNAASSRPIANSRHFITLSLPERTGDRFARLSFNELDPAQLGAVQFELDRTEAFLGTPDAIGDSIAIADTWGDETGTSWIEFDSPLPPGTTLTLAFTVRLDSRSEPRASSQPVEFGIAAYPESGASPVFAGNASLSVNP